MVQKTASIVGRYPVTLAISTICIAVFAVAVAQRAAAFLDGYSPLTRYFAFNAVSVIYGGDWRRVGTAAFVHGGAYHLASNLFALLFLGSWIEEDAGWLRTLIVFAGGVLAGEALVAVIEPGQTVVGCSAGILALATYAWLIDRGRLTIQRNSLCLWVVGTTLALNVVGIPPNSSLPGHVGGALAGFVFGLVLGIGRRRLAIIAERGEDSYRRLRERVPAPPASTAQAAFKLSAGRRGQLFAIALAVALLGAVGSVLADWNDLSSIGQLAGVILGIAAVAAAAIEIAGTRGAYVAVGPSGITYHRLRTHRTVPWDGIQTVYPAQRFGGLFPFRNVGVAWSVGGGFQLTALGHSVKDTAARIEASRAFFADAARGDHGANSFQTE